MPTPLSIYPVSPLIKIFSNTPPPARDEAAHAARGECVSFQIVIMGNEGRLVELDERVVFSSPLGSFKGRVRVVGLVPVRQNTPDTPIKELAGIAPGLFPDPLFDAVPLRIEAGEARSLWISASVPPDCLPGTYTGSVHVFDGGRKISTELALVVHRAVVPEKRSLSLSTWVYPQMVAPAFSVTPYSEEWWARINAIASDLALHRQNVVMVHLFEFLRFSRSIDGRLAIDFSTFDRYVECFDRHGAADRIEGHHLGHRKENQWKAKDFVLCTVSIKREDDTIEKIENENAASPACRLFLSEFLPLLVSHLDEKGWRKRYLQHIADEPTQLNAESWKSLAHLVREFAPDLRLIDATMSRAIEGAIDVWVPLLDNFQSEKAYYKARAARGEEVWYYTCLYPRGRFPNRFIDFSLLKVRLLPWIAFRYNLQGYLHWGYNWWSDKPLEDVEPRQGDSFLPPGDNAIVYPGRDGVISSIRWEMMAKGAEDYELLRALERKRPDIADAIVTEALPDLDGYIDEAPEFDKVRLKILTALDLLSA